MILPHRPKVRWEISRWSEIGSVSALRTRCSVMILASFLSRAIEGIFKTSQVTHPRHGRALGVKGKQGSAMRSGHWTNRCFELIRAPLGIWLKGGMPLVQTLQTKADPKPTIVKTHEAKADCTVGGVGPVKSRRRRKGRGKVDEIVYRRYAALLCCVGRHSYNRTTVD